MMVILKSGIIHKRKLENKPDEGWLITDKLILVSGKKNPRTILLNWLLPDWQFKVEGNAISFNPPFGNMRFELFTQNGIIADGLNIIRSGKSLMGKTDSILHGWYSPTYGVKNLLYQFNTLLLICSRLKSRLDFPS